jgi:hypothetical protein
LLAAALSPPASPSAAAPQQRPARRFVATVTLSANSRRNVASLDAISARVYDVISSAGSKARLEPDALAVTANADLL